MPLPGVYSCGEREVWARVEWSEAEHKSSIPAHTLPSFAELLSRHPPIRFRW